MEAHVPMATRPVDPGDHRRAQRRRRGTRRENVDDLVRPVALDRVDDSCLAAGEAERPGVARLPAARRVEHRPGEPDAALVRSRHRRLALAEIGVVTEQEDRGHGRSLANPPCDCNAGIMGGYRCRPR